MGKNFLAFIYLLPYALLMNLEFCIPMRPISLNHSHMTLRNGRRIKTNKLRQYEVDFNFIMDQIDKEITEFTSFYTEKRHSIKLSCFFYIPEEDYFTKPKNKSDYKRISLRSSDLDNMLKITVDLIFKRFGIDDKCMTSLMAEKIPSTGDAKMIFHAEIIPMPSVYIS